MVSTLSCFLLFKIVILTNGNHIDYNEKSEGLIQKLSSLKAKHGLNFVNIEGIGSLLAKYKDTHPKVHYIELDDPNDKQDNNPTDVNYKGNYKDLEAMNKFKAAPIRHEVTDQLARMNSLRICKKVPKELTKCKREPEEEKKSEDECGSNDKKKKKRKEKKRYYRAGNDKKHHNADETAKLLDDLESLLAKNGKYNIFLGCVGNNCGSRSNREKYSEDKDNAKVEREYLDCTGDRCGRSRDDNNDDEDTDVRRRY